MYAHALTTEPESCYSMTARMSLSLMSRIFVVADFDGFGGVAGEEDAVALLDLHFAAGAVVEDLAGADGDDRAAGWLVLGGVGDVNAAGGLLLRFLALDDDFVAQRLERDLGLLLGGGCGMGIRILLSSWIRMPMDVKPLERRDWRGSVMRVQLAIVPVG